MPWLAKIPPFPVLLIFVTVYYAVAVVFLGLSVRVNSTGIDCIDEKSHANYHQ